MLGLQSLTSRQAGMNRSLGEGFPWEPACFQPESSALARDLSQAVGPAGERTLLAAWRGSKAERRAGLALCQGCESGWMEGPSRSAGAAREKQAEVQDNNPCGRIIHESKVGGRFPGSETRERLHCRTEVSWWVKPQKGMELPGKQVCRGAQGPSSPPAPALHPGN